MKDWTKVIIKPSDSILKAIQIIDQSSLQIALIVDDNNHLLGTVTDGDIRRSILKGLGFDQTVEQIMNPQPYFIRSNDKPEKASLMMKKKNLHHIPVLDDNNCLLDLKIIDELFTPPQKNNQVILMAGGLGTRLRPLTDNCPKPLLNIGGKPILQSILESFIEQGFHYFYVSVNYKAEMIKEYFGNGSNWSVQIEYLHENKALGTAGALSLLPTRPSKPVFVMNGDILTKVDFNHMLDFHRENEVNATIAVREYKLKVPYGVVTVNKENLDQIIEKPVQSFFVNAGLYTINPEVLEYIPYNSYFDMPELFKRISNDKKTVSVFPIREYWLDIGQPDDYQKAQGDYLEVFK